MLEAARQVGRGAVPPRLDLRGLRGPAARRRRGLQRGLALPAPDALQRVEGGGRPRGAGLRRDLRAAHHHHQLRQQLRPLPVPREADPALLRPGARRPGAHALRQHREPPRVAARPTTTAPPSTPCSPGAGWGRRTTSAAAWRRPSWRWPTASSPPWASRSRSRRSCPTAPVTTGATCSTHPSCAASWAGRRRWSGSRAWRTRWRGTPTTGTGGSRCGRGHPSPKGPGEPEAA